jgi:hypothetical protein
MVDDQSSTKKPATNKTVKQVTVNKASTKKASSTKKVVKKAPVKKAVAKKSAPSSNAKVKTSPPGKQASVSPAIQQQQTISTIETIIDEMRHENKNRDNQISSLVKEFRQGLNDLSKQGRHKDSEHEKEIARLYESLQSVFTHVNDSSKQQEDRNLSILKALSESMLKDHELTLKEVHEQDKVQDKKILELDKINQSRTGRNRLIAVPAVIIAIIAIIYMFYVVSIMEKAMTSMSTNIEKIQFAVIGMSENMKTMNDDTSTMSNNMSQLNQNIGLMSQDLNALTYNVAPTMKGMRDMMPWSP